MDYLGLKTQRISATVVALNKLLADYQVYYQNLRSFHWNISGENFFDLHNRFEELYNDARLKIDELAERILTLRERPLSRLSDYLSTADVEEAEYTHTDREMVKIILKNHRILIADMRQVLELAEEAKDEGTTDMIGGFLAGLEKDSWMLDAWRTRKSELDFVNQN
ncbi:MAG: DNA starvation/stationary phase protection protein [Bacteroidota bacterium]